VCVLAVGFAVTVPGVARAEVDVTPVSFSVSNPVGGEALDVAGTLYRSSGCTSSVMLLVHGLSYGQWAWDFPAGYADERLSVARDLADAGYAAVSIDLPGYGASEHPNGYTLTVQGYAAMVGQIAQQLRTTHGFAHVGLMGHSAGTEISEIASALYPIDVLVATAYTHFPSQRIVTDFITGDITRAALNDYEYFGGNPSQRLEYMYNAMDAEPAVMAKDNELAANTPSGEILSIGSQPSRFFEPLVTAPVLLVLAQNDLLFPVENGPDELALFALAQDKQLYTVPLAGHSFMLHREATATSAAVSAWLGDRAEAFPACG
jgi:pimeloyl-ACP methyl ester carboxylesterase